jgi:hypothetical protein
VAGNEIAFAERVSQDGISRRLDEITGAHMRINQRLNFTAQC